MNRLCKFFSASPFSWEQAGAQKQQLHRACGQRNGRRMHAETALLTPRRRRIDREGRPEVDRLENVDVGGAVKIA